MLMTYQTSNYHPRQTRSGQATFSSRKYATNAALVLVTFFAVIMFWLVKPSVAWVLERAENGRASRNGVCAALVQRAKAGELRLYLGSWGSYSINDVSAMLPNFLDGGADDYARDPDVIKWLVEGGSSNDAEARKKAYSAAIQRVTEQAYWEPLHTYVTTYGYSKQLDFTPYSDELPRFYLAKWK